MYVIDSTALIEWPQLPKGKLYAPPKIFEEAKSLFSQIKSKQVQLQKPSSASLEKVRQQTSKTNDKLSEADQQAVALALDLGAVLVSDDYAVQNVAAFLGVRFMPLSKPGIKKKRIWGWKCSTCGRWLDSTSCGICGGKAVRAVRKELDIGQKHL